MAAKLRSHPSADGARDSRQAGWFRVTAHDDRRVMRAVGEWVVSRCEYPYLNGCGYPRQVEGSCADR